MKQFKKGWGLLGTGQKTTYILGALFALIAIICMPFLAGTVAGATFSAAILFAGMTEGQSEAALTAIKDAQKAGAQEVRSEFLESIKGLASEEKMKEQLKAFTDDELVAIKTTMTDMGLKNAELKNILKAQGDEITALKEKGVIVQMPAKQSPVSIREKMATILHSIFKSDDFKKFEDSGFKGGTNQYTLNGNSEVIDKTKYDEELREKAVNVTGDHTGSVLLAEISKEVRAVPLRTTHVRNLMTVRPTAGASIVAPEVYGFTDAFTAGATMLAENTEAPLSVFKTKENTWSVKRIARAMEISKRYFKTNGLGWVVNWILSRLPDQLQFVEDFQLLFGDGTGNNVDGIAKNAQPMTLTSAYTAGSIASVASYNGGTQSLITFAAAHGIRNGDNLTIAAATAPRYNVKHTNVIVVDEKNVIINLAYVAEASTALWTGTWTSYWYKTIKSAQEYDAITVAKAILNAGEYQASGVVLHSNTAEKIGLLKDLQAAYIGVTRDAAGNLVISAMPIAVTNAIPAGHCIVGDFQRACELAEFTPLTIQISEDTTDKRKNQVTVIAEEEIIFPLYNPYWFMYFKFSDVLSDLTAA